MENSATQVLPSQVVVFDLDGTLLDSRKQIRSATQACVQGLLADPAWLVVYATARPPRATFPLLGPLLDGACLICYNGSQIYKAGRLLSEILIPETEVRRIILGIAQNFPELICGIERDDACYVSDDFSHHFPPEFTQVVSISGIPLLASPKILVDLPRAGDEQRVVALIGESCTCTTTDAGKLLQVMARGVSKKSAVELLLAKHGLGFSDCICFGDDLNDAELFQACGRSVAMANAHPELKLLATDHTLSNDEEGVASFLEFCRRV